jgi:peptidyl-prolyl cis-trans isomerase SurA
MRKQILEALLVFLLAPSAGGCAGPEVIDRIVAVVNRQIITLGDVEEEKKYLQLGVSAEVIDRNGGAGQRPGDFEIVRRLIQQTLIREEVQTFAGNNATPEEVQEQLRLLEERSGGKESFEEVMKQRHITMEAHKARLEWQIRVLKFLESRFRQFVVILPKEIEEYYRNSFLPEVARKGIVEVPPMAEVEGQIRDLLIEEKVNIQIDGWLNSLTRSADIEIFD